MVKCPDCGEEHDFDIEKEIKKEKRLYYSAVFILCSSLLALLYAVYELIGIWGSIALIMAYHHYYFYREMCKRKQNLLELQRFSDYQYEEDLSEFDSNDQGQYL